MLTLLALTCPAAYFAMKAAAVDRHIIVSHLEGRGGSLEGWHNAILDLVYPL